MDEGESDEVLDIASAADPEFAAALRALDVTDEWRMRAIVGRVSAELAREQMPEQRAAFDQHGMSRASSSSERQAWRFGFDWQPGALPLSLEEVEAVGRGWRN